MKFRMEIELDRLEGEHEAEVSRILRYWAGNLKHCPLEAGAKQELYDSRHAQVGAWTVQD